MFYVINSLSPHINPMRYLLLSLFYRGKLRHREALYLSPSVSGRGRVEPQFGHRAQVLNHYAGIASWFPHSP